MKVKKVEVKISKVKAEDRSAFNCPDCKGEGLVGEARCPKCSGTGKV